jgi:hypothetical protein
MRAQHSAQSVYDCPTFRRTTVDTQNAAWFSGLDGTSAAWEKPAAGAMDTAPATLHLIAHIKAVSGQGSGAHDIVLLGHRV